MYDKLALKVSTCFEENTALAERTLVVEDEPSNNDSCLTFNNLVIDLNRHEVRLDGEIITLKPKEYDLLLFLARHKGQVLSRHKIMEHVWGWEFDGGSRTIDVHIRWIRKKIETNPGKPSRIITIRGTGYCFNE